MPQSMMPAFILDAIVAQAYNPDEQSLLIDIIGVVSGMPDINCAILK